MITPSAKIGTIDGLRNYSTDGLILNVDFSNDYGFAGNTANDLANRSVTYATPGGYVAVVSGSTAAPGYIQLDGSTDYLVAGITTAAFTGLTSCSFDVWIRPTSGAVTSVVFGNGTNIFANNGFNILCVPASGSLYPRFFVGANSALITTVNLTGLTFSDGVSSTAQWTNIFFRVEYSTAGITASGKVFKPSGLSASNYTGLYINAAGVTQYAPSPNTIHIGRRPTSASVTQFFNGQIGSVRAYNRLLTTDEIEFNYTASRTRYGHT